jgi:hypothetical protein
MSPRKLLRIGLIVVIFVLAWRRWAFTSTGRLMLIVAAVLLLLALLTSGLRKPRNPRDDVPKRPLGLDS